MQYCPHVNRAIYSRPQCDENYSPEYHFKSALYPKVGKPIISIEVNTTIEEVVQGCLENNIDLFNKHSIDALVAVAMATKVGNLGLLEELVKRIGIEILNSYDRNYHTPLLIACFETHKKGESDHLDQVCAGVKKLIELGANPNIVSSDGYTPLSVSALKVENKLLTKLLLQKHAKLTSCVSHLRHVIENKRVFVEHIIRANIEEIQKNKAFKKAKFLHLANLDANSHLNIFPKDIIKVLSIIFWDIMAYKE